MNWKRLHKVLICLSLLLCIHMTSATYIFAKELTPKAHSYAILIDIASFIISIPIIIFYKEYLSKGN